MMPMTTLDDDVNNYDIDATAHVHRLSWPFSQISQEWVGTQIYCFYNQHLQIFNVALTPIHMKKENKSLILFIKEHNK